MCLLRVLLLSMACHVWRGFGLTRCDSCRWVWRSSANEGHLVDALALRGDEGRGTLRKARGRCERSLIPGSPNGATHRPGATLAVSASEFIGCGGEPGELKHLSSRRKGHQRDSVSSGERTRTRPVLLFIQPEPIGTSGLSG